MPLENMTFGTVLGTGCRRPQNPLQFRLPPWMTQRQTEHLIQVDSSCDMYTMDRGIPCSSWLTNLERIDRMVGITIASNDSTTPTANTRVL